jgi:hypothetical protein
VGTVGRTDYAANGGDKDTRPATIGIWSSNCGNAGCGPPTSPWPPAEQTLQTALQAVQAYRPTGIVHALSAVKASQVLDGLNNTYLAGEKYLAQNAYTTGTDPGDNDNMYIGDSANNTRWVATAGQTLVNGTVNTNPGPLPPMQDAPQDPTGATNYLRFGSMHPATFSMVFCDGATRSISFSINPSLHMVLGNRNIPTNGQVPNLSSLGM